MPDWLDSNSVVYVRFSIASTKDVNDFVFIFDDSLKTINLNLEKRFFESILYEIHDDRHDVIHGNGCDHAHQYWY